MRNAVVISLLMTSLTSLAVPCVAADAGWGKWEDDSGANIYEFLPNNEFRFLGIKKVWLQHQGFHGNPFAHLPWSRQPRGQHVQERTTFSGAWETGSNICTAIVPESGKVAGNLKIYVESVECCMEAKRLGPTLVLRPLSARSDGPEVCVGRALRESVPEAPEPMKADGVKP